MNLAILALGLALSLPASAAAPSTVQATLHRGEGYHRIELKAAEPGWTFVGDAARGVNVVNRPEGGATVLVLDHVLVSGSIKVVMEKDGETRELELVRRIRA